METKMNIPTNFDMFTDTGNALVRGVVITAINASLNWEAVCDILYDISKLHGYEEASDTAVREAVYMALENNR
jgi:hypothetical protein